MLFVAGATQLNLTLLVLAIPFPYSHPTPFRHFCLHQVHETALNLMRNNLQSILVHVGAL
jgi:hypothetical protein